MTGRTVLLVAAVVGAGSMGGLLFGWMVSVIPGLKDVSDQSYVATMKSINVAIVNPWFVVPFLLTPVLLAVAAVAEFGVGNRRRAWLLGVAAATYAVGVLAVTVRGNIPLNDALDSFAIDAASSSDLALRRATYEGPWNRWHLIRTISAAAAFAMAAVAAALTAEPE